ncbi:MAG: hypothetical protein IPI46_03815 [Bacteroidetes bacterium]|nr:hypothetical protein [Bacteroidota bacterium]
MLQFFKLFVILIMCSVSHSFAQSIQALSFRIGVHQTWFKPTEPGQKTFGSYFLPDFTFQYMRYSDNLFWGGIGLGVMPRNVPFYEYANGQKTGASSPEFTLRFSTGFRIERSFSTHLPYLGLGISKFGSFENWIKNGNVSTTYTPAYKLIEMPQLHPSIEIGTSLINSTFRDDKRNVYMHFAIRYYPLKLFKETLLFEYEPFETVPLNYNLVEFIISAGLQKNFRGY